MSRIYLLAGLIAFLFIVGMTVLLYGDALSRILRLFQ